MARVSRGSSLAAEKSEPRSGYRTFSCWSRSFVDAVQIPDEDSLFARESGECRPEAPLSWTLRSRGHVAANTPDAVTQLEVAELRSKVRDLEQRLAEVSVSLEGRPTVVSTFILDLGRQQYEVMAAIPLVIEHFVEEVVARWPELCLYGSGSTESEAISDLKDRIVELSDDLRTTDEATLGKLPREWKRILAKTVSHRG
jgi:hypothetical protein